MTVFSPRNRGITSNAAQVNIGKDLLFATRRCGNCEVFAISYKYMGTFLKPQSHCTVLLNNSGDTVGPLVRNRRGLC